MPNRLAECSSPYLRQHQNNPVDWYPWCEEALTRAVAEDKPIFLSVGYSACHWCHVMEHESFENPRIAEILNEYFISIKVDREERPDIDQIYMQAVQLLTGSGGWPMSVFLSGDGKPFYGGTYWPPENRWGRPGFGQVLMAVADAWRNKRDQIAEQSQQITQHLQASCRGPEASSSLLTEQWIDSADRWLLQHHDGQHGGFGAAPKFPHAMDLLLWIELSAHEHSRKSDGMRSSETERSGGGSVETRTAAIHKTLDHMWRGGIYDHLGGGFARYSVDERWLVPHFEKMLYDNALLASVYANAYRLWKVADYGKVVRETLDYVIRDMTHLEGGYFSTEDADSEGVEGKFYLWTPSEVQEVLGRERGELFCLCYDVTEAGNFEEANILNLPKGLRQFCELRNLDFAVVSGQLDEDRRKLLQRRQRRVRPARDDKVLVSWNGLMIRAMTDGYRALGDSKYLESAHRAVEFLVQHLRSEHGQWWHSWRDGEAVQPAYLDDLAYLMDALCELFQVDSRQHYLELAIELAETLLARFAAPEGGFYFTADNHEHLIARSKDLADSSVPSGNSMAAAGLCSLARLTGREEYRQACERTLMAMSGVMAETPQAAGQALRVLHRWLHPGPEYVLLQPARSSDGADGSKVEQEIKQRLLGRLEPGALSIVCQEAASEALQDRCPSLRNRKPLNGGSTLFVCRDFVCDQPMEAATALEFLQLGN